MLTETELKDIPPVSSTEPQYGNCLIVKPEVINDTNPIRYINTVYLINSSQDRPPTGVKYEQIDEVSFNSNNYVDMISDVKSDLSIWYHCGVYASFRIVQNNPILRIHQVYEHWTPEYFIADTLTEFEALLWGMFYSMVENSQAEYPLNPDVEESLLDFLGTLLENERAYSRATLHNYIRLINTEILKGYCRSEYIANWGKLSLFDILRIILLDFEDVRSYSYGLTQLAIVDKIKATISPIEYSKLIGLAQAYLIEICEQHVSRHYKKHLWM